MDDQRFDNNIRQKLANYEEPGFDHAALASLHARLDATAPVPWHVRYRTELIVLSGLAVCTLVILYYFNYTAGAKERMQEDQQKLLTRQQAELLQLRKEVRQLHTFAPDTVWIITTQPPSASYNALLARIAMLEDTLELLSTADQRSLQGPVPAPADLSNGSPSFSYYSFHHRLFPRPRKTESVRAVPTDQLAPINAHEKRLSPNAIRELERHYSKGIGIRVGPAVGASYGFYPQATGRANVSLGVLADLILSPSLSVETGVNYAPRYYEVENTGKVRLPRIDTSLGEFEVAEIDAGVIEIPINLKYRYPFTIRTHGIVGMGYSPMIYYRQVFEYSYQLQQNEHFTIGSTYNNNKLQLYPGTFNFSLGLDHTLKNKKIIETSLYYQHSLGKAGVEKVSPRYFGLRAVYWFPVR